MTHFLIGYCNKMLFLGKLKDYQKKYGTSTTTRGLSKHHKFIAGVPDAGIAPGHLFQALPNYNNNIRNGWKKLLTTAKDHFEKALDISKSE